MLSSEGRTAHLFRGRSSEKSIGLMDLLPFGWSIKISVFFLRFSPESKRMLSKWKLAMKIRREKVLILRQKWPLWNLRDSFLTLFHRATFCELFQVAAAVVQDTTHLNFKCCECMFRLMTLNGSQTKTFNGFRKDCVVLSKRDVVEGWGKTRKMWISFRIFEDFLFENLLRNIKRKFLEFRPFFSGRGWKGLKRLKATRM